MFCKNCGSTMDVNASVCVKCGVAKGVGASFCPNCGESVAPNAAVCLKCGSSLTASVASDEQKSKLIAGLLGIFLGGLGIHNFYLGYTGKAIAQIALSFCFGIGAIWGLIEGIMILCGSIKTDAKGNPLKD